MGLHIYTGTVMREASLHFWSKLWWKIHQTNPPMEERHYFYWTRGREVLCLNWILGYHTICCTTSGQCIPWSTKFSTTKKHRQAFIIKMKDCVYRTLIPRNPDKVNRGITAEQKNITIFFVFVKGKTLSKQYFFSFICYPWQQ